MAVKVLITRRCQEGAMLDVLLVLSQLRSLAVAQPGYITGETLYGLEAPDKLLVISTWEDLNSWRAWRDHPARREVEAQAERYLLEPASHEAFRFGAWQEP